MIVDSEELRDAILDRDAIIERVRASQKGLLDEMYEACRLVERLANSGIVFEVSP
jgi:hypothetical protein